MVRQILLICNKSIIQKIINIIQSWFQPKKLIPKRSSVERLEEFNDEQRASYSDSTLLRYFESILHQCKYCDRKDDTLLKYINELEYRGVRYRL